MFDIKVTRWLNKPIEDVFESLADHANYQRFNAVEASELIEPGHAEPNGEGALRRVVVKPFTLFERIVKFERPHCIGYQIERSSPIRFVHEIGQVNLIPKDGGTEVTWISKGYLAVPIFGKLFLDKQVQKQGGAGFASILKAVEQES